MKNQLPLKRKRGGREEKDTSSSDFDSCASDSCKRIKTNWRSDVFLQLLLGMYRYFVIDSLNEDDIKEATVGKEVKELFRKRRLVHASFTQQAQALIEKKIALHEIFFEEAAFLNEMEPSENLLPFFIERIRWWIEEGANLNAVFTEDRLLNGKSVLRVIAEMAAEQSNEHENCSALIKLIVYLHEKGADVNAVCTTGVDQGTSIIFATIQACPLPPNNEKVPGLDENFEVTHYLIEKGGANVNFVVTDKTEYQGVSPLMLCAARSSSENHLEENYKKLMDLLIKTTDLKTINSICSGNIEQNRWLGTSALWHLARSISINSEVLPDTDSDDENSVRYQNAGAQWRWIKRLIEKGAEIDSVATDGEFKDQSILQFFLKSNANEATILTSYVVALLTTASFPLAYLPSSLKKDQFSPAQQLLVTKAERAQHILEVVKETPSFKPLFEKPSKLNEIVEIYIDIFMFEHWSTLDEHSTSQARSNLIPAIFYLLPAELKEHIRQLWLKNALKESSLNIQDSKLEEMAVHKISSFLIECTNAGFFDKKFHEIEKVAHERNEKQCQVLPFIKILYIFRSEMVDLTARIQMLKHSKIINKDIYQRNFCPVYEKYKNKKFSREVRKKIEAAALDVAKEKIQKKDNNIISSEDFEKVLSTLSL